MVDGRHGPLGLAHFAAGDAQAVKGLRRGHFVYQMEIDVEQRLGAGRRRYQMLIPHFFE